MKQESAHVVALQALEWLAGDEELFATFLGSTGASATDIAERAGDEEFLAAILDFLLMNDEWIVAFCDRSGFAYTTPTIARAALAGGRQENWT